MKTKPQDVSSTILPPPHKRGFTYCLQRRNIEESADQNHHLENKKEKVRGDRLKWEIQGAHHTPFHSPARHPATPGTQRGRDSSLGLHYIDYTAEQWGLQESFRSNTAQQKLVSDTRRCTEIRLLTRRRSPTKAGMQGSASIRVGSGGWEGSSHSMLSLRSCLLDAMASF